MRMKCLGMFLLLPLSWTLAQGSSVSSSQLKIPATARSAALGEGTVSDAGQFSSWFVNPANLISSDPVSISLTHAQWIQEIQTEHLGLRMPLSAGTVGLSVSANSVPGIEIRDVPGPSLGTFSARFVSFQAGYAQRLSDDVVLGAAVKYLYEKLYIDEASGYGFDAGILYSTPIRGLSAGMAVTNIGSLQQFRSEASDLPSFSRIGVSYRIQQDEFDFVIAEAWAHNLRVAENHLQTSIEATYSHMASLRFGYQTGYDTRGLSAGIGLQYDFFQLDYAYVPFSLGLGDAHLFSLGFQF